jgi:AraC-like DNA-binding protein
VLTYLDAYARAVLEKLPDDDDRAFRRWTGTTPAEYRSALRP